MDDELHRESPRFGNLLVAALTVCASMFALGSVGWIEVLNARAGYILPRKAANGRVTKWRVAALNTRRGAMLDEKTRMEETANADLRDAVRSIGVLQYLVAPAAIVLGLASLYEGVRDRVWWRSGIGVGGVLSGVTAATVVYLREYWGSLGL